jgi:hypothetical protein
VGQTANSSDSGSAAAITSGLIPLPKQGTTQQVASSLVTGDKGIKNAAKSIFSAMPLDDDRKTRLAGQVFGTLDK